MTYEIILSPEFIKKIEGLQNNIQKGILKKIKILEEHPDYGKTLQGGLKGLWELKLSKLRIFYTIDYKSKAVRIVTVDFRSKLF